jgi:hypothetical protein
MQKINAVPLLIDLDVRFVLIITTRRILRFRTEVTAFIPAADSRQGVVYQLGG